MDEHDFVKEVDTGVSASLINEATFRNTRGSGLSPTLQPSALQLCNYSGEEITVWHSLDVTVQCGQQAQQLP